MIDLVQEVNCLTSEEVKRVLYLLHQYQWKPTALLGGEVNTEYRSSSRACLEDHDEASSIMHEAVNRSLVEYRHRLTSISPQYDTYPLPSTYQTSCFRERFQVLCYGAGEYYKYHTDQAWNKDHREFDRTVSVVLYLTDGFEGGATEFPWGSYKPKAGQALIFPSNWCFPHQSQPVISGSKVVAVTWYHSSYNSNLY